MKEGIFETVCLKGWMVLRKVQRTRSQTDEDRILGAAVLTGQTLLPPGASVSSSVRSGQFLLPLRQAHRESLFSEVLETVWCDTEGSMHSEFLFSPFD